MKHTQLTDLCRQHLAHEEHLLGRMHEALQEVQQAIGRGGPKELAEALQQQEGVLQAGASVAEARHALRRTLASALTLPEAECTLESWTIRLSADEARPIVEARHRLRQLRAQVDRLNHRIAVVSHYQLDFLQHLFGEITGAGQHGARYGREGKRQDAVCGSLIELRG